MDDVHYRIADPDDAELLARLNQQLIRDEGHRNRMTLRQLTARMLGWLGGEYQAVVFEEKASTIGYALFKSEPEFVYLRQLFVAPEWRRRGVARKAIRWMWLNAWASAPRVRIDVLVGNASGIAFWHSVGFEDYCITMESLPPVDG